MIGDIVVGQIEGIKSVHVAVYFMEAVPLFVAVVVVVVVESKERTRGFLRLREERVAPRYYQSKAFLSGVRTNQEPTISSPIRYHFR